MHAEYLIRKLDLQPHPEGGFYKRTYTSPLRMTSAGGEKRNVSTAIFYMLRNNDRSVFHRIKSDELWFFHQGGSLEILFIKEDELQKVILGNDIEKGEIPQFAIEASTWFACRLAGPADYTLVSCMVSPGFEFADFELAQQAELISRYPHLEHIIKEFT